MKICFIHPLLRDYRTPLFNMLAQNFDLEFIFTSPEFMSNQDIAAEFKNAEFKYQLLKEYWNPIFTHNFHPFLLFKLLKYDTIIASTPYTYPGIVAFFAAKLFGKKLIYFDETWMWPDNFRYRLFLPLFRFIIRGADGFVLAGSKAKEFYLRNGTDASKIFIAPNAAVDYSSADISKPQEIRQRLGLGNKFVFLYFGRVLKYKGLDILIGAFEKLRKKYENMALVVAGSGDFLYNCKKLSENIPDIYFAGRIAEDEKPSLFAVADVFVLPARFMPKENVCCEAWGLALNEVMSIGRPAIATTAVGAAYDMIKNGKNGYLIEQNNENQLAEAMEKIFLRKDLLDMGNHAKETVKNGFNHKNMFDSFVRAIILISEKR